MHDVVIVGELLAIAAIVMCLAFVVVDLGRPDRFWHMIPGIGRFNWPISMLTWDVIVLNGYLLLNLHICGYLLYMRFLGAQAEPALVRALRLPLDRLGHLIHTVTAFLYSGLGGRPFWNSALLAPRFLASAFVTGPAFIVLALQRRAPLHRFERARKPDPDAALASCKITVLVNLFMVLARSSPSSTRAAAT
jgi:Ni/Fe-hydrogenase subunit HybB-like protein